MKSTGWLILGMINRPHVMPLGDLREHIVDDLCWCGPTDDDGVMVHHSLDLREEFERGRKMS